MSADYPVITQHFCSVVFNNVLFLQSCVIAAISLSGISLNVLIVRLQFGLNPQVLPFYPRSLLSDSCFIKAADSAGGNDVYRDFPWSLEEFCGISSDDMTRGSTVGDEVHVSRTDSRGSWDVSSDFSADSRDYSSGSFDAVSKQTH